jgi:transcriptional regulator with XRE-family HTH domain
MSSNYKLTLSNILQELILSSGISEAKLADRINIPTATLNKLKTGKIEDPRMSTLVTIASYFGLTVDQLLGNAPIEKDYNKLIVHVPIIEYNNIMKTKIDELNFINHKKWISIEMINTINKNSIFAIYVQGSAMEPYFDNNMIAVIDTMCHVKNQQYVLAYIKNTNEIIIRQILIDGETKILKAANQYFTPIKLTQKDIILGEVIYTLKDYQ